MNSAELERELSSLHEASFGWSMTLCRWSPAEADEVLQAAYLKVLEGQARFEGRSSFRTWLFGVIRQTASERRRRQERQSALRRFFLGEEPEPSPSAGALHEVAERTRLVRAALLQLSERQRQVLDLVFFHGLTLDEAAGVMGLSVGSVRVHYHRAKEALRELLRSEVLDESA